MVSWAGGGDGHPIAYTHARMGWMWRGRETAAKDGAHTAGMAIHMHELWTQLQVKELWTCGEAAHHGGGSHSPHGIQEAERERIPSNSF